jgi:hypothetical protein
LEILAIKEQKVKTYSNHIKKETCIFRKEGALKFLCGYRPGATPFKK